MRLSPAQKLPRAEGGFVMIEVLVSALVITIVAGAVLALVSATTRSAADQRSKADAYALAQEDQARLRNMRLAGLNGLQEVQKEVAVGQNRFEVESSGVFVNNTTGTSASCSEEGASADYVKITSTVRWNGMPDPGNPVRIQSIVAPSNGSLDPSHGTLAVQTDNGAGEALSGVKITGTGTSNFSGTTDETGCANFADLPAGNYTMTTDATGFVDTNGAYSPWSQSVGVKASSTVTVGLRYDLPGTVPVKFVYRKGSSEEFPPAYADSIVAYNAEMSKGAQTFGTPGGTRVSGITAGPLFPFKAADTIYAGSCESNNPNPSSESNPPGAAAMATVIVPAGEAAAPVQLQLPALNLTVSYNGTVYTGAKVTVTDTKCKSGGSYVKRTYTTNANGNPSSSTAGPAEPGLPWGKYNVCASAKIGSEYRKTEKSGIAVENLTSGTNLELSLSGSGSSGSWSSWNQC
jgi:Tfp pilus assembly protein PilV